MLWLRNNPQHCKLRYIRFIEKWLNKWEQKDNQYTSGNLRLKGLPSQDYYQLLYVDYPCVNLLKHQSNRKIHNRFQDLIIIMVNRI